MRLVLAGAPGDTGNLGVSALEQATLTGLLRRRPDAAITVLDNGFGPREASIEVDGVERSYRCVGLRRSRRWHRPESLANVRLSLALGRRANPTARALLEADAVLDVSGGDSFSDLYGQARFEQVVAVKELCLRRGIPLVLLPQTYGPFRDRGNEQRARAVVDGARLAVARDARSYQQLCELAGARDDRLVSGVDLAFGLAPRPPRAAAVRAALDRPPDRPAIGLNVSGLIYNDRGTAEQLGIRADYPAVVHELARRFLAETDADLLLVPHVVTPPEQAESDRRACQDVADHLADDRVRVLGPIDEPGEVKAAIATCTWFCGTRMHATIAALSSGVPAAAVAYSGKAAGVFETCGLGEAVADLRSSSTGEVVEQIWHAWCERDRARHTLAEALEHVRRRGDEQLDRIVEACEPSAAGRRG